MRNRHLIFILSLAVICFALWYFRTIVVYIIIAGILSLIGQPIDRLYGKLKLGKHTINPSLSAAFAFLTLLMVFFLLVLFFVPLVMEEARLISSIDRETLFAALQEPIIALESFLRNLNIDFESGSMQNALQEKLMSVFTVANVSLLLNKIVSALGDFFMAVFAISFFTFFFLRDEKLIMETLLALVPEKNSEKMKNIFDDTERLLKRYFIGILSEMALVITFLSIGLWIAGVKHALLLALFAGLVNIIPYVGPLLGIFFALLIGITTSPEAEILYLSGKILLVFLAVLSADAFFLQPLIYSGSVKAHPLEIFLVILLGAALGGIGGMLLAVPSYTVLRVIAKNFFAHLGIVRRLTKGLEEEKE